MLTQIQNRSRRREFRAAVLKPELTRLCGCVDVACVGVYFLFLFSLFLPVMRVLWRDPIKPTIAATEVLP